MKVVSIILIVVLIGGLLALCVWQGIKLVKQIREYIKKRKELKKNIERKE